MLEWNTDSVFSCRVDSELGNWDLATQGKDYMGLDQEIKKRRAEVRSDGYPMSIGELINLYRDGELDIHPEFQRFYRWSNEQKSRLVESILLGIPIPSIFVSQREDGVWDVIDGLQRLSTVFELAGELRDSYGRKIPPLTLTSTKYLPSLHGKRWTDDDDDISIGVSNQLLIRRSKIDVKIILRESSDSTKYELFQRLNTGALNSRIKSCETPFS